MRLLICSSAKKRLHLQAACEAVARQDLPFEVLAGDLSFQSVNHHGYWGLWEMPDLSSVTSDDLFELLRTRDVSAVVPTRDGELHYWSRHRDFLLKQGIHVFVGNPEGVKTCLDKYAFYEQLRKWNFPVVPTMSKPYPSEAHSWVVKDRLGSGSRDVHIEVSCEQAEHIGAGMCDPIYQPNMVGQEWSADLWISSSGVCVGVVLRTRDLVIDGEARSSKTFRNLVLENQLARVAKKLRLQGAVNFQGFINGHRWHILECNARVSGSLVTSIYHGLDVWGWTLREVLGENLDSRVFQRRGLFAQRLDGE